jgi:signal transduction histidine kinase
MKLAAALAVPLLGLVAMIAVELAAAAREVDRVRTQTTLARAAVGPSGLITVLQNERSWPALELTGAEDLVDVPVEDYTETRRQTNDAIAGFRRELDALGPDAVAAYRDAMAGLGGLDGLRADIDADEGSELHGTSGNNDFADMVYARYTAIIRAFFDATDRVVLSIQDTQLRRGIELVSLSSRQIELLVDGARAELVVNGVRGGVDTLAEIRSVAARRRAWVANAAQFERAAPPYDRVVAEAFPRKFVDRFTALVDRSLTGEQLTVDQLLWPLDPHDSSGLARFRMALADELTRTADRLQHEAQQRERTFLWIGGVTLVAAVVLAWLVSRSITRPLRSLTRQAKQMAERRLPAAVDEVLRTPLGEDVALPRAEPVEIEARDEVIEVATALNRVQQTALDLAVEQAVLRRNIADSFVNLGRRNQNLLRRQLDFITEFEHRETDPDALANLFRLDHLATRMRRNAESLLVLAGTEPTRRWAMPVSITEVVRASLGEVEDYQRAMVRGMEPATIVGSATADLAHLVAELVENALVFSPPEQAVEIRGRRAPDGGYVVAVIDAGEGMTPDELAEANRRLAGAESFTVSPSNYLGHYVAGNLAARHGIRVSLRQAEPGAARGGRGAGAGAGDGGGVTAVLELPRALLAETPLDIATAPPSGGRYGPVDAASPLAPVGWPSAGS